MNFKMYANAELMSYLGMILYSDVGKLVGFSPPCTKPKQQWFYNTLEKKKLKKKMLRLVVLQWPLRRKTGNKMGLDFSHSNRSFFSL